MKDKRVKNVTFSRGYLKEHIKTIHDCQKEQNCDICSKSFPTTGQLNQHIKNVHEKSNF